MPLVAPKFAVLIADPTEEDPEATTELIVTILHGDQLRAELEGPKNKLPKLQDAPQHYSALWVWAALTRTKVIKQPFQEFKRRVLVLEAHEDEAPADELEEEGNETDPTQQGAPSASD